MKMTKSSVKPSLKPAYVYVTYIATTPNKAFQALVDVDMMRQWWVDPMAGCARVNVSDWKPGSRWVHQRADGSVQTVTVTLRVDTPIEVDYYRNGGILPYVLRQLLAAN